MPQAAAPRSTASSTSLQIFKPGRHTAMSGATLDFAAVDLQATAQAYDPAKHQAPLVVGHPRDDGPAYGWVQSVSFQEGALEAAPVDVDPAFAELVNRKAYKHISASFYAPTAPGNPVPGVYYLRHVGFLGAVPPAVRGLRSPSFSAADEGVVEFSEWDDVNNASLWRSLREWFIGKFGQDEADRVVPQYQVQSLEQGAQDEVREAAAEDATTLTPATPAFAQPTPEEDAVSDKQLKDLQAEVDRLKAEAATATAAANKIRMENIHAANVSFCEGLVAAAKLPKARVDLVVSLLDQQAQLEAERGAVVEFGEGDARAPVADALKKFLEELPAGVEFAEVATAAQAAEGGAAPADSFAFAASTKGAQVDPASQVLHRKVQAYQAKHPGTDYVAALDAVQAGLR